MIYFNKVAGIRHRWGWELMKQQGIKELIEFQEEWVKKYPHTVLSPSPHFIRDTSLWMFMRLRKKSKIQCGMSEHNGAMSSEFSRKQNILIWLLIKCEDKIRTFSNMWQLWKCTHAKPFFRKLPKQGSKPWQKKKLSHLGREAVKRTFKLFNRQRT